MRNKEWILTYNHLDNKVMGEPDRPELKEKFTVTFELYDDDGEHYFTGRMTEKLSDSHMILDPLDYCQGLWGCTEMKINGETI